MAIIVKVSQEQINKIIDLYINQEKSLTEIAKNYDFSRAYITKILRDNNINFRTRGSHLRKYPINENYFDNIDTEDKAYFLGLLYADGCNYINKTVQKVRIELQEEDKYILEAFSKKIYYGIINIKFLPKRKNRPNNKNTYDLTINNKHISNTLYNLGCINRKSLVLKFPHWLIDSELQRHFIRGYFDGDGSIYTENNTSYSMSIISAENFCDSVKNILKEKLNVNISKFNMNYNDQTKVIRCKGNRQVEKVMDWLYKDATIYLKRKHDKYLELKEWIKEVDECKNSTDRHINQYL